MNKTPLSPFDNHQDKSKAAQQSASNETAPSSKITTCHNARREARAEALYNLFLQQKNQY